MAAITLLNRLHRRYFGRYRRPSKRDVVVAAIVSVIDVIAFSDVLAPVSTPTSSPAWLLVGLGTLGGLALVWRRGYPGPVLVAVCVLAMSASTVTSYRPILIVCVALASATARCSWRMVLAVLAIALATAGAWLAGEVRTSPNPADPTTLAVIGGFYAAVAIGAMSIGAWLRAGQLERSRMADRNAEQTRWAIVGERRRMAHELHDIVGNTVTVMILQAAGARRMIAIDPKRADDALAKIDELGAQAMRDLRQLLGVLKSDVGAGEGSAPAEEGSRQPGIANVAGLIDSFGRAGLRIEVAERGTRTRLEPHVETACQRLLQEALTNAVKHAGQGARVRVHLNWLPDLLEVSVESHGGSGAVADARLSTGNGLAGLSERVMLAGGELVVDPQPRDRGFRVSAIFPQIDPHSPFRR